MLLLCNLYVIIVVTNIYNKSTYIYIKHKKEVMKMQYNTKVRPQGASLVTTIPSVFVNLLKISERAEVIWEWDPQNPEIIQLKLKKE